MVLDAYWTIVTWTEQESKKIAVTFHIDIRR